MKKQNELNNLLEDKMKAFIEKSSATSSIIKEKLINRVIEDMVVPAQLIWFEPDESGINVLVKEGKYQHRWMLNTHSAYQVASKLGVPTGWASNSLKGMEYEKDAVCYALNRYNENYEGSDSRFLLRIVEGVIRGFLSTSYRRMNTKQIFLMFLLTAEEMKLPLIGAMEGSVIDYLEVIDPNLIWIDTPENGLVAYCRGMVLKNCDWGAGKLELRSYWKKAICLNGLIGYSYLKEVHLGQRLPQDFVFSIETINKETEVKAMMVRDAMHYAFSERARQIEEAKISHSSSKTIDIKDQIERLPSLGINKTETKLIENVIMNHKEEDGIYGNPSMYLLANAISAIAREVNPERSRELQEIAGKFIFNGEIDLTPDIFDNKNLAESLSADGRW